MTDNEISASELGWLSLVRGGNGGRSLVITGGVALHAVSIYVVATIMPIVVGEIGGIAFFAWTATLYIAGSLTGSAGVPLLLGRFGPRGAYRVGFGLFMLGSLVCSVAPSMPVLLVGRLIQGFGGGMLPALAYATIRVIFAPAVHARAITLLGSVWGVAALLGPTIGGVFAQVGAWRAAFWVDLVIGLVFVAVAQRVLPAHVDAAPVARRFPGVRLGLLAAAAVAVSAGGVAGRPDAAALGLAVALALVAAMLLLDSRAARRLLPTGAFSFRTPIGAVSATMGLMILSTSPCNFVPYILLQGQGLPPIAGGYVAALLALAWTGVSLVTAGMARPAVRGAILIGPFAMAAGLALDGWALGAGSLAGVVAGQVLIGAGIGMGWAHLGALLMQVAPAAERDIAGPFITTTQTLAAAFGSAIAGMVANMAGIAVAGTPAAVDATAPWLFGTLCIAALAAGLAAWRALALTRGLAAA